MVQRKEYGLLCLALLMAGTAYCTPSLAATELNTASSQSRQEAILPAPNQTQPALPETQTVETQPQIPADKITADDDAQAATPAVATAEKTASPAQAQPAQGETKEESRPEGFAYPDPPAPKVASTDEEKNEFAAALSYVYLNHPQLKAERENLKSADEGVAQAVSGFRPNVTANYIKGRGRNNTGNNTWYYANNKTESLQVSQPIFQGGQTLAQYASAKKRVEAGRAQLTALEQDVLLNAVVAYTDVVQKQYVLEANQHNVDVLTKQFNASKSRFEVGELTRTDVAQSQARLASAKAAERQALGDLAASRATFRRVIGYDAPPHVTLPCVPEALPATLEEATHWAEVNNPVLEAAKHLAEATDKDVDARTGALLPSVNLEGTMSRRELPAAGLFRQVQSDSDQVALNVTIPLYQSGAEWSRIRQARNVAQQAKFNAIDTRYSVVENVARAWQDYHTAKAIITSNEEAVNAAQEALDGVRQENLYGTRTILDVLDTEQDYFNARVNLVIATVAEKQQAYRLLAAVGHLTAENLKLAVDLIDPQTHYDDVKYQLIGF